MRLLSKGYCASTTENVEEPIGEVGGASFISMEYVEGETLQARIARGAIPVGETVHIAIEIADALSEAHERGIVHRDIKPANIMLTRVGHVKVMDLGLAKSTIGKGPSGPEGTTISALTATHTVVGSLPYLSPEQARGEEVDPRSDIFSLGCVLYEMFTGRRPFDGTTPGLLFDQILNHDPVPLWEHDSAIPSSLDTITSKALEKDRELRYQSFDELRSDLDALDLEGFDYMGNARWRTLPKRLQSLTRPRIAAAAAIVLALAAAFVYWNVLAPRSSPLQESEGAREQQISENLTIAEDESALVGLPTENAEAYDFFLRGRTYEQRSGWKPEDRKNAQRMYEQALALDPGFALARPHSKSLSSVRFKVLRHGRTSLWLAGFGFQAAGAADEQVLSGHRRGLLHNTHICRCLEAYSSRGAFFSELQSGQIQAACSSSSRRRFFISMMRQKL